MSERLPLLSVGSSLNPRPSFEKLLVNYFVSFYPYVQRGIGDILLGGVRDPAVLTQYSRILHVSKTGLGVSCVDLMVRLRTKDLL